MTQRSYRIHPSAVAELDSAADWYDSEELGLGMTFIDTVGAAINLIVARPQAWQRERIVGRRDVRRFVISRFPFVVVYYVESDAVHVIAVAHTKRAPGTWHTRVGDFSADGE